MLQVEDIKIGLQFIRRGTKRKDVETIVDILRTYSDVTGDLVNTDYLATHDFMGQTVKGRYCATTIQMAIETNGIPK